MPNVKTIELTGTETAVTFPEGHPYYWIINLGNEDIYASANPNIVPDGDGVYLISAGDRERISPAFSADTVFIVGKGKVKIRAEEIAACPSFSRTAKGGEGNGFVNIYGVFGYVTEPIYSVCETKTEEDKS